MSTEKVGKKEKKWWPGINRRGVGSRIRIARAHRTQTAFASDLGVRRTSLSEIENGQANPSLRLVARVASLTGVNVDWLITGEGEMRTGSAGAGAAPARLIAWRESEEAKRDPALYKEWVPLLGCYTPDGIVDLPERGDGEALEPYLGFGPVPMGSVALRLLLAAAGYPGDAYLVFGPVEVHFGQAGFGLFTLQATPRHLVAAWSRRIDKFTIFSAETTIQALPRVVIIEYRSFVAFVP